MQAGARGSPNATLNPKPETLDAESPHATVFPLFKPLAIPSTHHHLSHAHQHLAITSSSALARETERGGAGLGMGALGVEGGVGAGIALVW